VTCLDLCLSIIPGYLATAGHGAWPNQVNLGMDGQLSYCSNLPRSYQEGEQLRLVQ
jgi:hypothetical protein